MADHVQRIGVKIGSEVFPFLGLIRIFLAEQRIVQAHLGVDGVRGRNPVDRGLHLAAIRWSIATARGRIIGAVHLDGLTFFILHHFCALHEVGVAQTHFPARRETEILLRRMLPKIILLDVQHA